LLILLQEINHTNRRCCHVGEVLQKASTPPATIFTKMDNVERNQDITDGGEIMTYVLFRRDKFDRFSLNEAKYICNPSNWNTDIKQFNAKFSEIHEPADALLMGFADASFIGTCCIKDL
jgi:hypothetical protein